jgi:hypothetical protein
MAEIDYRLDRAIAVIDPDYADQVGLDRVLCRIQEFARNPHGDPGFWTPAPLLQRLAESAGKLES